MDLINDGLAQDASQEQPKESGEPPQWFRDFVGEIDKRFEGVSAKIGKLSSPPRAESPKKEVEARAEPAKEFGFGEGIRYGELRSKLSDAARERVDGIAESNPAKALEMAELLSLMAPANGASLAATPPPGKAASAAPNHSPSYPETTREFMALVEKARTDNRARDRLEALREDPGFDPEQLRRA